MKRKLTFGIFILVVLAGVLAIVFVNLFSTPSTKSLADSLNSKVSQGYLSEVDKSEKDACEYNDIQEYLTCMQSALTNEELKNEVQNIKYAYQAFLVQGEFFNRQIVFTTYSDVFKTNKKKIENLLNQAQKLADGAEKYIEEHATLTSGSAYWTAQTWSGVREDLIEMTNKTAEMFTLLGQVYSASVDSEIMNNDLTTAIFRYVDESSTQMAEKISQDGDLGYDLYEFVNVYFTLSGEKEILNYYYDIYAQTQVEDILERWEGSSFFNNFLAGGLGA